MRLWRISDFASLDGAGGRLVDGRWHSRGRPIVYLSEHPALSLVETMVHLDVDPDDLPDSYQLLEVDLPDAAAADERTEAFLAAGNTGWRADLAFTRSVGDAWLASGNATVLRVPSVVVPKSANLLLNPAHPDSKRARIVEITRPAYDRRLFA